MITGVLPITDDLYPRWRMGPVVSTCGTQEGSGSWVSKGVSLLKRGRGGGLGPRGVESWWSGGAKKGCTGRDPPVKGSQI